MTLMGRAGTSGFLGFVFLWFHFEFQNHRDRHQFPASLHTVFQYEPDFIHSLTRTNMSCVPGTLYHQNHKRFHSLLTSQKTWPTRCIAHFVQAPLSNCGEKVVRNRCPLHILQREVMPVSCCWNFGGSQPALFDPCTLHGGTYFSHKITSAYVQLHVK